MARHREHREKHGVNQSALQGDMLWPCLHTLLGLAIRTLYLFGPPGCGKTFAAYHFGRPRGDVYAITLTPETAAAELRGCWIPHGNEFVWHDGPFTAALREGARLV